MRKALSVILLVVMAVSLAATASAESRAATWKPTLQFRNNTAYCEVVIQEYGSDIEATLELWSGGRRIDYWSGSGTSVLVLSGSHAATSGTSYTLKLYGTIDDVAFTGTSVTGICP